MMPVPVEAARSIKNAAANKAIGKNRISFAAGSYSFSGSGLPCDVKKRVFSLLLSIIFRPDDNFK